MMDLKQIENLLLQEMEDVKGGVAGTCECTRGAGQGSDSDGTCYCTDGGAGQLLLPPSGGDYCLCLKGAGQ